MAYEGRREPAGGLDRGAGQPALGARRDHPGRRGGGPHAARVKRLTESPDAWAQALTGQAATGDSGPQPRRSGPRRARAPRPAARGLRPRSTRRRPAISSTRTSKPRWMMRSTFASAAPSAGSSRISTSCGRMQRPGQLGDGRRRSSSRTRWRASRRDRAASRPARSRPWFSTTICSATSIASSWSWVTNTVVTCTSSCRRRSQARSSLRTRGVERAEGLVEQQHARLDRQRPGERHALALAARELGRVAVGEAVEVHELRAARRPAPRSPPWAACGSSARRPRSCAPSCA